MHLINPTILAQSLLPPMLTRHLVLLQGKKSSHHNTQEQVEAISDPTPKKQRRVVTNNNVKHVQLDMGMFWLHNPTMKMNKIFPCDLRDKIRIQFCCRGQECKRDPDVFCPFLHPCSSEDLKLETIKLITDHFLAKKVGWFNEYHFPKLPGLKPKYKALLGSNDRLTSKTA